MASGDGILCFETGEIIDGTWKNGYLNGSAKYTLADGTYFYGYFVDGIMQGNAQVYFSNGEMDEGHTIYGAGYPHIIPYGPP